MPEKVHLAMVISNNPLNGRFVKKEKKISKLKKHKSERADIVLVKMSHKTK